MPVSSVEKSTAEKIDQYLDSYVQAWPVAIADVIEAEVATTLSKEELPNLAAQMGDKKPPEFISALLKSLEITARFGGFEDMSKFNIDRARGLIKTAICKRLNSTKAASENVDLPPHAKTVTVTDFVKSGIICTDKVWIPKGSYTEGIKLCDKIIVISAPELQGEKKDGRFRDAYRQWQG